MKSAALPVILYLAENFPFAINGGSEQRIAATILTLTQSARVRLLCFHPEPLSRRAQKKIFEDFAKQVPIKLRQNLIQRLSWTVISQPSIHQPISWQNWLSEFWTEKPFLIWQYQSQTFKDTLVRLLKELNPGFIHVCHLRMAGFLPNWLTTKKIDQSKKYPKLIYEAENVEWQLAQSQADYLKKFGKWRWWWLREAKLIKKFERNCLTWFDQIYTLSQTDTDDLKKLGAKQVTVLPILYPATLNPHLPKIPAPTQFKSHSVTEMVFVGNLNWLPNADAVKWFLSHVWPIIISNNSHIRLTIIGKPCEFFQLTPTVSPEKVMFTGLVKNIDPYLAKAQISILPFRMGGGVRFKALTAAWAGHAIISTDLGIQGLNLKPNIDCLVANNAPDFAQKILEIIKHPNQIKLFGKRAQSYLLTHHGLKQYQNFWTKYKS